MQIAFVRTGRRYFMEIERDDGAVLRMGGVGYDNPPHDVVHYVVESELGLDLGFFGRVARGEIIGKVELLEPPSRRRKPLGRPPRGKGVSVELIVGLVTRVHRGRRDPAAVEDELGRVLTHTARARAGIGVDAVVRICERLDRFATEWARVPAGGRLVVAWPAPAASRPRGRRARIPARA